MHVWGVRSIWGLNMVLVSTGIRKGYKNRKLKIKVYNERIYKHQRYYIAMITL